MELGAPSEPSRGTGDCLALAGLNPLKRDRAAIRASEAEAEAERRWRRQLRAARVVEEEGQLKAALRPPGPPRPAGSVKRRPD